MNLQTYRQNWLRSHRAYEKRALKILRRTFKSMAKSIPFDQLTIANYSSVLEDAITPEPIRDAYIQIYLQKGLIHGRRVGQSINKDLKAFTFEAFAEAFKRYLYSSILEMTNPRRMMLRENFIDYFREIIGQGAREGKTIQQISREITKMVNNKNFYYWQSVRIARTETTSASNHAVVLSAQESGIMYNKIWIATNDNRTRTLEDGNFDHRAMNGIKEDAYGFFNVNGEQISFPGAMFTAQGDRTSAGNVINCRCTVGIEVVRDRNGRPIRRL